MRTYCKDFEKDWDDGIPLHLFTAQEVTQESFGFSPAELMFGYTVRGLLKLLKERWLENQPASTNLLDFVCRFRSRLHKACELAKKNLGEAQERMKGLYDKKEKQCFVLAIRCWYCCHFQALLCRLSIVGLM